MGTVAETRGGPECKGHFLRLCFVKWLRMTSNNLESEVPKKLQEF